jgi:hypothetical protein
MKEWWKNNKDNVLLGVLALYVLSLAVVTVDTIFGPWLFPPKLDREISVQIERLQSMDSSAQGQAMEDLINDKGDFAVPALIKMIQNPKTSEQGKANAMNTLTKITEQSFGQDQQAWISWFQKNKSQFP